MIKNYVCLLSFMCISCAWLMASPQLYRHQADSLFLAEEYTQAAYYYEKLYQTYHYSTPQMLIRLAFLKEGSGDYVGALYYLNLYYRQKPDKKILRKIQDLAQKNELIGYEFTDIEQLLFWYNHYYVYVVLFLLLVAALVTTSLVRNYLKKIPLDFKPYLLLGMVIVAGFLINYPGYYYQKGIVWVEEALLMNAPSAAATPQERIKKGSRISIKNKQDVWYEIDWKEQKMYLHEQNVRVIQ